MTELMPYVLMVGMIANVIAVFAGLWKGIRVLIMLRDDFRDMAAKIGTRYPPEGLLGDVEAIKHSQDELKEQQAEAHLKIAVIESGLATRRTGDKRD